MSQLSVVKKKRGQQARERKNAGTIRWHIHRARGGTSEIRLPFTSRERRTDVCYIVIPPAQLSTSTDLRVRRRDARNNLC